MRKNRLIERLAVAYKFVRFGRGMCRIMTCGQCGSVYIRPISEHPMESSHADGERRIDLIWSELSQCVKCGAACHEIQCWNFDGDPTKIDEGFVARQEVGGEGINDTGEPI